MKKGLLFGIFIIMSVALFAQERTSASDAGFTAQHETHVTPTQALNVGYTFMSAGAGTGLRGGGTRGSDVRTQAMQLVYTGQAHDSLTGTTTDCYYVFALQPKGFVIVAADDRVEPILGYSYDNNFEVANMPDHVRGWLGGYEKQIEAVVKQGVTPATETSTKWSRLRAGQSMSTRSGGSVGPLLTTTWDQGQYYNNLCPADANGPAGHVLTGCVATAMAQIINYWGYPVHGRGTHSYESNYGTLTVNYGGANYDYTNMPVSLSSSSSSTEIDAVATLMRDCGVAVNMSYAADESSAFDQEARAALINFFRYSPDMSFAEKAYFTNAEWETMLRNDLDAGNPVYYSGQGTGGHAFVCDGYNADGYFSFNFGWGGYCNGWYLTSNVNPGGSTFNDSQSAIFGIVPDSTGNVILGQTTGTSTFTVDEPMEFYHLMGHNAYEGGNYDNSCNSTVHFVPSDSSNQIVADILDFEDQTLSFYDGNGNTLRYLHGGSSNDLSPVVSSNNTLKIEYSGNLFYAGFKLNISQMDECRMVSNITSHVDTTTVHLTWTENGGATQWEIEYGIKGFGLGTGTLHTATTNTITFNNLPKFKEYDFYIRPICGANQYGPRKKVTVMVEAAYWQDIVTSQPEGYVFDATTNTIEISTAEGLAWWSKNLVFGHGQANIRLIADIDLSGYKWRPAEISYLNIDGQGHLISNAYVREDAEHIGFFSRSWGGNIENLGLTNSYIKGNNTVGGLCGYFISGGGQIVRNCYVSNSTIDGCSGVGGLVGFNDAANVTNCYVNVNVIGTQHEALLIGDIGHGSVQNCYAAGSLRERSYCYNGGITASSHGEISNCYSVETRGGVIGEGEGTNISTFRKTDSGYVLLTPIFFDEESETDLLVALNRYLEVSNDSSYCMWMSDTGNINEGFPVFGSKYVVQAIQCPNVSNVSLRNVITNDNSAVRISWTENGDATQWRIRYRLHDRPDTSYAYIATANNPDTIYGLPLLNVYDFNVRAICDTNDRSGWSETQTLLIDLPYWTDVVTTQPSGYVEDVDGNVEIYSAEGLAWLAVKSNGFNGQQQSSFSGKTVTLKSDINIEGYRWYPIGEFSGVFNGQKHNISNIYMNGESGLFGYLHWGSVKNVHLNGGTIRNGSGGLIGSAEDCPEISDCHSSATVYGDGGSLCGGISGTTYVFNCSSSGTVYGHSGCGSLIGSVNGNVEVHNCYATGDVNLVEGDVHNWYRGGLIGYIRGAHVNNCFSTGTVEIGGKWNGKVIGMLDLYDPHIHYVYGLDTVIEEMDLIGKPIDCITYISDTSQFHHDGNTNALLSPVLIDGMTYSDMLDALNAWVILQNDPKLRLWILDSITGYPIFGDYYIPSCYNPADLMVSQATAPGDAIIKTRLTWTQEGETDHWEVRYVAKGQSVEIGTTISIDSNSCVLAGIPIGMPLDFYVRAFCGEDDASGWCGPVTYLPDKLRWTEVVTLQPEGFQEDGIGNVYISSAEGLSWISSIINEINGAQEQSFDNIILTNDIDLSAYRWDPVGKDWNHQCNASFNGNNHVIFGLYCNELSGYQGLFGFMSGEIKNLVLTQCDVRDPDVLSPNGTKPIGGIVGYSLGNHIVNCMVTGSVCGGGIAGSHICYPWNVNNIENCCFIGNDNIKGNPVGITSTSMGGGIFNCYVVNTDAITTYARYYIGDEENSDFTGSGSTWTLTTPPYINGAFRADLVDALNAWVDDNNTEGQYDRWAGDTAMVNGGYPIFESVSLPAVTAQDTVVAQGYYSWHGIVFTSDTVVTDTITTLLGYDSVVTYHIFVNPIPITEITKDTCSSYIWNGEVYHETGDYVQSFTAVNNSDSVVILHLSINPLTGVDEHFICDNSYTWIDGVTYVANNNTANYTLQTLEGCDSVVTLHLTYGHKTSSDTTAVACDSFDWYEQTNLTQSGDYTRILTNANGCDSVVTLHLTIGHPTTTIDEQIACDSFTWIDSNTYTESTNEPTFTLTSTTGCDSVVTLHLIVNHTTYGDTTALAYDSFDWYEYTGLTQIGNYMRTFTNAEGCDSIITLHLTFNNVYWTDVVTSQPEGYQEDENGNVYISSAEGLSWLSSVVNELNGAHNRQFNHIVLTNDIDLSAYRWRPIGNSGNYFRCASFNGNNHIVSGLNCQEEFYGGLFGRVLRGEIRNLALTQSEVHGQEFVGIIAGVFLGTEMYNCKANGYVSGSYYIGGLVGYSTSNLENSCFIGTVDANDCSGGICGGLSYGDGVNCYAVNETATEGMITGTCYNPDFVSNCYYKENGTNTPITSSNCVTSNNSGFTGSGTIWTLSTPPYINGSYHTDLVDALNAWVDANNTDGRYCRWVADTAMVNRGYPVFEAYSYPVIHDTVIAHESYSWHGMVFTSDTVLADTILTSTGHFNVLIHHLMVYHPVHTAIIVNNCDGYSWGGATYNTSGDYTYSHLDANGCTQVDTLHLTVRYSTTGDTTVTVCDSFDWYEHTGITQSCENLTHTFTNVAGCDSVVTLHLTINKTTHGDTTAIACNSFDWYEHTGIMQSCDNLTHTFTNAAGCDSVVTLHLTINYSTPPTVTTNTVSDITATSATCGGNVTADGGATVTARGVCWSTSENPTVADSHTTDGSGAGTFTSQLSNLEPSTIYYVRAYATNSKGTAYGESVSFTTPLCNPLTVNILSTSTSVLLGESVTLSASGTESYSWSTGDIGSYITVFPTTTTTYSVTGTAPFGCEDVDSITITVNVAPETPIVTVDNDTVCAGAEVTLSVTNPIDNVSYIWYADGMAIAGMDQANMTVFLDQAGTHLFSVKAVNAQGYASELVPEAAIVEVINPQNINHVVVLNQIAGIPASNVCEGTQLSVAAYFQQLDENGNPVENEYYIDNSLNYAWMVNGVELENIHGPQFSDQEHLEGSNSVDYTYSAYVLHDFPGCEIVPVVSNTVHVMHNPIVTLDGVPNVCYNGPDVENVVLTAWVDGGVDFDATYTWYENGQYRPNHSYGNNYAESWGPSYGSPYAFTVEVTNGDGCTTVSEPFFVNVNELPVITAVTPSTVNVCNSGEITITASTDASSADGYFTWYRNGFLMEHATTATIYDTLGTSDNTMQTYVYSVSVFNPQTGCTSASVNSDVVTVYPAPTVQISGNQHVCETEPVTLTANVVTDGIISDNAHYVWFVDGQMHDNMAYNLGDTNLFVEYLFPRSEPYHFSVQVSIGDDASCTSQSEEYLVYVHTQPNVYVVATETSICVGGSTTIMAVVNDFYDESISYNWSDGNSSPIYTFSPSSYGPYTLTVTVTSGLSGCSSEDEITIQVNEIPEAPVVTADNTLVFDGGQVTLTVANPVGYATYIWYRNGELIPGATQASLVQYLTAVGGETTTYSYVVRASLVNSGCVSDISAPTVVTVGAMPVVTVAAQGNTMFCEGGSVTLHADVTPYNDPTYSYQWYEDGMLIPGATTPDYVVYEAARTNPYNFMVMVSAMGSGFITTAYAPPITIVANPVVTATISEDIICAGGTATLTATVEGGIMSFNGYNYQWFGIVGAYMTMPDLIGTEISYTTTGEEPAGNYPFWVSVSNEYGCNSQSEVVVLSVVSKPAATITRAAGYDGTVCEGGSTALVANVNGGYGSTNYQWLKNGFILPNETDTVLTINDLTSSTNDVYAVSIAQEGVGCSGFASTAIHSLVTVVPHYTVDVIGPDNVCEGDFLTLFAAVDNTIPGDMPSYQWHEIVNGQDMLVEGANSVTYTVAGLQSGNAYDYYVVVNSSISGCSAISASQAVNVNVPSNNALYENACNSYTWNGTTYTETGEYTQTFTGVNGCDSVVTLHLTINQPNFGDTTAIAQDIFDWYEHSYLTMSGDYTHIFTNQSGCDSVVTLHLTITNPTISVQDTVMTAGYFIWHGMVFTSDTVLTETIPVLGGYDSVVFYHVFVTPTPLSVLTVDTCVSYTLNGQTYAETGDYVQNFPTPSGIDSVVVLYLTIFSADSVEFTETACGSYPWNGETFISSGDYTRTFTNANGCDSVVTLHLTISPADSADFAETACGSYPWNGETFTTSGDYTRTFTNANGCDSVVTLHLTIYPADSADFAETACESFTWNGTTYTTSGDYTQIFTNASGCDSVVTLHLTIYPAPVVTVTADNYYVCESGEVAFTADVAPDGLYNYAWTINDAPQAVNTATVTTVANGFGPISASVIVSFANAGAPCTASDTIDTPVTVVEQPSWTNVSFSDNNLCLGETILLEATIQGGVNNGGDTNGYIQWVVTDMNGLTLNVTSGSGGSAYDIPFEAGIYNYTPTFVGNLGNGCQLTNTNAVQGMVTVHEPPAAQFISGHGTAICDNDPNASAELVIAFMGVAPFTYQVVDDHDNILAHATTLANTASLYVAPSTQTTYTITMIQDSYCENTDLTSNASATVYVNAPVYTDLYEAACEHYTLNYATYDESGDYTQVFPAANGCDSIITLHLTVNFPVTNVVEVTTSDSCYTWNSETYCASGQYTQTLQTIDGCDSTVYLFLTITVGIDDHSDFDFNLYPNPTNGMVNVQCTMNNVQAGTMEYHVFDAYGKLVDVVETRCTTSLQTAQIDLSGYAAGVYFVKALAEGNVVAVRKVVKR